MTNSFSSRNPFPSSSARSQICSNTRFATAGVVALPLANVSINSPASSPSSVPLPSVSAVLKSAPNCVISSSVSKGHSVFLLALALYEPTIEFGELAGSGVPSRFLVLNVFVGIVMRAPRFTFRT